MLKIGHRGARAYEPENTIRSYRKAIELGANAVELDVRKTMDDQLVVIHDADVKKTTNGEGLVEELTLEEMKDFSTEKDEKIPTLEEALDFLDEKVKIFVELKESGYEKAVLELISKKGLGENVVIVSFVEEVLQKIRNLDSEIETGLVYAKHKNPLKTALDLKAQWLLGLYRFVHSTNVQKAHENHLKVLVWTVNNRDDAVKMAKKGVDGIASDKPDILKDL